MIFHLKSGCDPCILQYAAERTVAVLAYLLRPLYYGGGNIKAVTNRALNVYPWWFVNWKLLNCGVDNIRLTKKQWEVPYKEFKVGLRVGPLLTVCLLMAPELTSSLYPKFGYLTQDFWLPEPQWLNYLPQYSKGWNGSGRVVKCQLDLSRYSLAHSSPFSQLQQLQFMPILMLLLLLQLLSFQHIFFPTGRIYESLMSEKVFEIKHLYS